MTDTNTSNSFVASPSYPRTDDGFAHHAVRGRAGQVEQFLGIIRSGPRSVGEGSDYSDARYYVDRAVPRGSTGAGETVSADMDSLPGLGETVTATNLAEVDDGSHLLAAGSLVQVFVLAARSSPDVKVYVFDQRPMQAAVVQISASAEGAGEYSGKILGGVAIASPSGDLGMPAGLSSPSSDDALVLNVEEDGQPGHRLAAGSYAVGVIRGITSESPPRKIVLLRGGVGRTDSATTLGSASDSSETAESTTWSKASDATPVSLYLVGRVVYNAAGDQTLYAFVRALSFDARGLLYAVSAETRVTVDITEACS